MSAYALIKRGLQIAGLAVLCAAASASAARATNVGWVFADQPGAVGSYTPDPAHSYNSSGGSITVTNVGVGTYTVDFAVSTTRRI
jgi:hypothetical protein